MDLASLAAPSRLVGTARYHDAAAVASRLSARGAWPLTHVGMIRSA